MGSDAEQKVGIGRESGGGGSAAKIVEWARQPRDGEKEGKKRGAKTWRPLVTF